MKKLLIAITVSGLVLSGPAAIAGQPGRGSAPNAVQAQRRPAANVQLTVTDASGRTIAASELPPQERQRVASLRSTLQQWGNQQAQSVGVIIRCSYPPLRCEIIISF